MFTGTEVYVQVVSNPSHTLIVLPVLGGVARSRPEEGVWLSIALL